VSDILKLGLPARAALAPGGMYVELYDIGPQQLQDPFLGETVKRVSALTALLQIPKADLGKVPPGSAPAGIIFHVSRCGSTLASQLLKLDERVVVYAEPQSVNELLVPPQKGDRSEIVAALRSLGACFARHAGKPYVLKLSSWNTLYCDVVAEAFPATPWALCIRDPIEVCVSLLQHRPGWLREPGLFAGVVDPTRASYTPEDYTARLYGAFCVAAGRLDAKRGAIVRYECLPDAIWNQLAPHFELSIDGELRARMSGASSTYSKAPVGKSTAFVPDDANKRAAASSELRQAVDAFARDKLKHLMSAFDEVRE
jgi:hypothetical protein